MSDIATAATESARAGARRKLEGLPEWVQEVDFALPISPQIVLAGNIRDVHPLPQQGRTLFKPTVQVLVDIAVANGYDAVIRFDLVDGNGVEYEKDGAGTRLLAQLREEGKTDLDNLRALLGAITPTLATKANAAYGAIPSVMVVIDYASRLRVGSESSNEIHTLLTLNEKLANSAIPLLRNSESTLRLYNAVVWIADRPGDLPSWLTASSKTRTVVIPRPPLALRKRLARQIIREIPGYSELTEETRLAVDKQFAELTDGMPLQGMIDVRTLAVDREIPAAEIERAVRSHRAGVSTDPWREAGLVDILKGASAQLSQKIFGQEAPIAKALDVLYRSHLGLNGSQSGRSHSNRPKGVLFFAGPTGVGKTELAKQLAELIFGTEDSLIRFDMSEYSSEASEARLVGAPPSFVGHEAGGQLTNAVRIQPFSILLFDEIEKAHESIPRKFLQVLEDGRLTDGHGETVSFSDTLIIFTSNRGTVDKSGKQLIDPSTSTADVQQQVKDSVHKYFHDELVMPELLNRIGEENVVVFDFIRPPDDEKILQVDIDNVREAVERIHGAQLSLSDWARAELSLGLPAYLPYGGRGIANLVADRLVNPVSRALFEETEPLRDAHFEVVAIEEVGAAWRAQLERR